MGGWPPSPAPTEPSVSGTCIRANRSVKRCAHPAPVTSVAFSLDGKQLLSVAQEHVHLWDVATGKAVITPLEHEAPVNAALLSADGKRLLTVSSDRGGEANLHAWDAAKGEAIGQPLDHAGTWSE